MAKHGIIRPYKNKPTRKNLRGKVAWCSDWDLPKVTNKRNGHFVYIRDVDTRTGKCTVSLFTSLDDGNKTIFSKKMIPVRNGDIYPIPKKDATFPRWTGLERETHIVDVRKLQDAKKVYIARKHQFMMGKK